MVMAFGKAIPSTLLIRLAQRLESVLVSSLPPARENAPTAVVTRSYPFHTRHRPAPPVPTVVICSW